MTEAVPVGRILVGTMHGFSGTATGHTPKMARRNVYQASGLYDASVVLIKNALSWDGEGEDETRTGLSVTPEPSFTRDPISGLWTAELQDATLKVWVERFQRTDRRFERRASDRAAKSIDRALTD
jgi:hypothetical protein|uniref:hypothetical protein n=1 Tax=Altererythrobacter segetis TaxID=1104773 RepID=UPI00140E2459|nr:hypothetical protein [Altererythrobacter segetis]